MTIKRPPVGFLIPLLLALPMLTVGPYGVSVAELLVVLAGVHCLLDTNRRIRLPWFLPVYLLLLHRQVAAGATSARRATSTIYSGF